jgi:hypothetical protein
MADLYPYTEFSSQDIRDLKPAMKIGILATVDLQGLPHLTLITTLMAASPARVVWGQFIEGASKDNIRLNPKAGFLVMSLDKQVWRGQAAFTHTARSGPDYDHYNSTPLFRYNTYFGVHTVYYMDLVAHTGRQSLPMNRVVFAAVKTLVARSLTGKRPSAQVMNPWTQAFFNTLDNLKFLGYVGPDGYPRVIPLIQAQSLDPGRLVFALGAYSTELVQIPASSSVAVFGMALTMEDVLVRGTFRGIRRLAGMRCGVVDLDWVYNSMPPTPMQIYPQVSLEPVREF